MSGQSPHVIGENVDGTCWNMRAEKKIAVIGAGVAGLTSIKSCLEENLQVTCFEQTNFIGGLWKYRERVVKGQGSVMKSTVTNTSKELSAFSDFPPPAEFPNFMRHTDVLKYLQMYADHFELLKHIRFQHQVLQVSRSEDYSQTGRWRIKVRNLQENMDSEEIFDGVMVCAGENTFPNMAKFPGTDKFRGQIMHSHSYKVPNGYEDKNVLVIGIGNSAVDVAVELATTSNQVYLSSHRGAWIVHRRTVFGWPADILGITRIAFFLLTWFPKFYSTLVETVISLQLNHSLYGLKPKRRVFDQYPTINDLLGIRLASGAVELKKDVKQFTETGVVFVGEESKEYPMDAVIMATGYVPKFPFLEDGLLKIEGTRCGMYRFMFHPQLEHPSLAIIGMVLVSGSGWPAFEMQSRFYARIMRGYLRLPQKDIMLRDIEEHSKWNREKFGNAHKHVFSTFTYLGPYMDKLASDIGVKPDLKKMLFTDIRLFWRCMFGPLVGSQYRLQGPHAWSGAREAILTVNERVAKAFKIGQPTPSFYANNKLKEQRNGIVIFLVLCSFLYLYYLL